MTLAPAVQWRLRPTLDELGNLAPRLRNWFDSPGVQVVIVRPDRYLLWAGSDPAEAAHLSAYLVGYDESGSQACAPKM